MSNRSSTKRSSVTTLPIPWGVVLLTSLLLARFLIPTEGPEQGGTLWLAALVFALAAGLFGWWFKTGQQPLMALQKLDIAVAALVGGHLLSGLMVFLGEGQRRAAMNLTWEWIAIGAFWGLGRLLYSTSRSRALLWHTFLAVLGGLSLLGIWQHVVWYPQQAAAYQQLFDYQTQLEQGTRLSDPDHAEYLRLLREQGPDVATLDAAGRKALLARVRDSVEPIGRFALTNSFAMPLMIACLLLLDGLWCLWRKSPHAASLKTFLIQNWCWGLLLLLVAYCLILTKSRTAWLGTLVGCGMLGGSRWLRDSQRRLSGWWLAIIAGVLLLGGLVGVLSGGLDREVLSEAPKSLRYRLEYWTASLQMLLDRPWWGAGPGNFRQHYLHYKLPGSSEEILDAHQLLLEVWSNGGLLALGGLLLLLSLVLVDGLRRILLKSSQQQEPAPENPRSTSSITDNFPFWLTLIVTAGVVQGGLFLLFGELEQQVFAVLGMALLWNVGILRQRPLPLTSLSFLAAFVASCVHLSGASGIEMPALTLLFLLLAQFSSTSCSRAEMPVELATTSTKATTLSTRTTAIAGLLSLGLLLGSLLTGVVPVRMAGSDLETGQTVWLTEGHSQLALRLFDAAAEADPLAPEPHQQRALVLLQLWQRSGGRDRELFDAAIASLQAAIERDPYNAGRYRLLGNAWDQRVRLRVDQDSSMAARAAVNAYARMVERYPHFAAGQAEYALALQQAGDNPQAAATRALELDDLNHRYHHTDKQLPPQVRKQLEQLLSTEQGE